MQETYNLLAFWLDDWKRRLENPRELIFERSFVNVARAAAFSLEENYRAAPTKKIQRSAKGWGRKLLELLEEAYDTHNPAIELLKLEYKTEVGELERQLKMPELDLMVIFPILEKIKEGLSLSVAVRELVNQLLLDDKADAAKIRGLSKFLLKIVLTKHGESTLKRLPQKSLAQHGAAFLLQKHLVALADDKTLTSNLWQAIFDFWRGEATPEKAKEALKENPESLFDIFDTYLWGNLTRGLMRRINEFFAEELKKLAPSTDGDKIKLAEAFETDTAKHEKIGALAVQIYIRSLLRSLFSKISTRAARQEDSDLSESLSPLGDFLLTEAKFDFRGSGSRVRRPNVVDLVATEAFADGAARVFSEYLGQDFNVERENKIIADVGRRLCGRFGLEIREGDVDWTKATEAEIETLCETFAARDVLHRELGLIVLSPPVNELLTSRVADVLANVEVESLVENEDLRRKFWNEWGKTFSNYAALDSHILDYLPWETIEAADLKNLLDAAFADFTRGAEEWTAVAIIPNLKANGKIWKVSDVVFFDAAQFDFGEKRWFVHKFSDGATFAKLTVRADTPLEAQRRAWERLNDVLNGFAFGLSLNESYGGFKTEIHPDIYVAPVSNIGWSAGQSLTRNDRPIEQPLDAFREFVAPAIEDLLDAARTPSGLNDLQSKLLHAWHWYNKGRWQPDATETIIYYWIGLEHLFGESGEGGLFDQMSRLGVTWSTILGYGWTALNRMRGEVVKMVEADNELKAVIEADSELTDWNKDVRILVNHQKVARLLTLIPGEKTAVKNYVENYRDYLQGFVDSKDELLADVDRRRGEYRFKLFLLKDLRNRMAHQALYYRPDIILYAEELQKIFENLLRKIADVGLMTPPPYAAVADYIDNYEQLWIS